MSTTIKAGNATNGTAISSDNTGILELKTGTGAGTTALTLNASQNATFAGTVAVAVSTTALYPLVFGTAVTTSGTSVDFTGIPSWAKRITIMLESVTKNLSSTPQIQVGSTTFVTTGYVCNSSTIAGAVVGSAAYTSGFVIRNSTTNTLSGSFVLTNITGNTWVGNGVFAQPASSQTQLIAGSIVLTGVLDRIRLFTVNGTDTFSGGTVNITWE